MYLQNIILLGLYTTFNLTLQYTTTYILIICYYQCSKSAEYEKMFTELVIQIKYS